MKLNQENYEICYAAQKFGTSLLPRYFEAFAMVDCNRFLYTYLSFTSFDFLLLRKVM